MSSSILLDRIENTELGSLLEIVRQFAEQVWGAERLLRGFTDHGPYHTGRVIARIEEFLQDAHLLSEDEAFVLLAACWLHDVGMQDYGLLEEQNPHRALGDSLSLEERRLVRNQHARRVKELLENDISLVLRRDDKRKEESFPRLGWHKRYVAEVAYGHSTAGFQDVKNLPDGLCRNGRDPFRPGLLAALLLLGDECDLDHSRAGYIDDAGIKWLALTSALHQLKHRYVTRSQIVVSPDDRNARQLGLVYNWPADVPDVARDYGRWIEGKILTQLNLVQPILSRELGIKLEAGKPFRITEPDRGLVVESPPQRVLPLLHAERVRLDLADLEAQIKQIKQTRDIPVHVLVETGNADALGAREIAILAIAELLTRPVPAGSDPYRLVEIDAAANPTATDPRALFERVFVLSSEGVTEEILPKTGWWLTKQAVPFLRQTLDQTEPVIVLLRNAHELPGDSRQFLVRYLIPVALQLGGALRLFVTLDALIPGISSDDRVDVIEMPQVSRGDVLEMLNHHTLYDVSLRKRQLGDQDTFTQFEAHNIALTLTPQGRP